MGSKNVPKITKKKTDGKSLGIANLNVHTLKKNKLAIAFNNLEMDKDDSKDKDSDSKWLMTDTPNLKSPDIIFNRT